MKSQQLARRIARDARSFKAPRMSARDGANPNSPNVLSRTQQQRQFGWIAPVLSAMGTTSRWAMSLNPDNQIVVDNNAPLEGVFETAEALYNAAALAVQGASGKTKASASWPVAPATQTLTLTANTTAAFGVYVRISDTVNNFKFGSYEIQLLSTGVVTGYVTMVVTSLPAELIILSISNNVGRAAVVPNLSPSVVFPYSAVSGATGNVNAGSMNAGNALYAETLNMRDIGNIVGAIQQGVILL
jgi:hypothetical protein